MTDKQKAKKLALTLVGEDQNPEPLIDLLMEMARWQREQMIKNAVEGSVKEAYAERLVIESRYLYKDEIEELDIRRGDKVKLIIIKEG